MYKNDDTRNKSAQSVLYTSENRVRREQLCIIVRTNKIIYEIKNFVGNIFAYANRYNQVSLTPSAMYRGRCGNYIQPIRLKR